MLWMVVFPIAYVVAMVSTLACSIYLYHKIRPEDTLPIPCNTGRYDLNKTGYWVYAVGLTITSCFLAASVISQCVVIMNRFSSEGFGAIHRLAIAQCFFGTLASVCCSLMSWFDSNGSTHWPHQAFAGGMMAFGSVYCALAAATAAYTRQLLLALLDGGEHHHHQLHEYVAVMIVRASVSAFAMLSLVVTTLLHNRYESVKRAWRATASDRWKAKNQVGGFWPAEPEPEPDVDDDDQRVNSDADADNKDGGAVVAPPSAPLAIAHAHITGDGRVVAEDNIDAPPLASLNRLAAFFMYLCVALLSIGICTSILDFMLL